jgi:hypothetical protein
MFNASTQNFITHVVGTPYDNFPLKDGVGYFIYVINNTNVAITSIPVTMAIVPLYPSWNLIGWYGTESTTAESLGNSIIGCTLVLFFDEGTQTFQTHVVGTPHNNFLINKGVGIFIYTSEFSEWHGEGYT